MTTAQPALPLLADPRQPIEPEDGTPEASVLRCLRRYQEGGIGLLPRNIAGMATDLSDRRVQTAIRNLRLARWPIVSTSDQSGYRLAERAEELEPTIRAQYSRMREMAATAEAQAAAQSWLACK